MESEKPEDEGPAPPSAPADPANEAEVAAVPEAAEAPAKPERVLDAGTSQELVIVSYSDDAFLHARHRELVGDKEPDSEASGDASPDSEDLQGLVIVRDVLSLDFQSTLRPQPPPGVPADAGEGASASAAPADAAEGTDEASPPWARRAPAGSFAPPPPRPGGAKAPRPPSGTTPAPRPVSAAAPPAPRPVSGVVPAPRPTSGTTVARRPPSGDSTIRLPADPKKPGREALLNRDFEDLFVKPDFSSRSKPPRADGPPAAAERPVSRADRPAPPRPERPTSHAGPPPLPPRPKRVRPRPDSTASAAPAPPERPRRPEPEGGAPLASTIVAIVGGLAFAAACVFSVMHLEPFHTWFYLFAWYPFLLIVNHFTATRSREHSIFSPRARSVLMLCAWSIPVWLLFEIFNFRLQNWYYVGVPDAWATRRLGIALSFATVLPGIFFLEEMQRVRGAFESLNTPPFDVTAQLEKMVTRIGIVCALLVLALPTFFFPLVWAIPVLLLEPWLRRRGDSSLLGELEAGRPERVLRLLVAGMVCGLFWEAANSLAGGKWIYTVPGFSHGKLFEMPVLGFVGFPPFALACWSIARALVQLGMLPDWDASREARREEADAEPVASGISKGARISLVAWSALAALLAFEGMDRWTVDSRVARPEDIPGVPDGVAQYAHRHGYHDVRGLVALIDQGRLHIPGASSEQELAALREHCRLVLLRGIGTANARRLDAVGVHTVEELATRDGASLAKALQGVEPGWTPKPRRVAVWVQAAQSASRGR